MFDRPTFRRGTATGHHKSETPRRFGLDDKPFGESHLLIVQAEASVDSEAAGRSRKGVLKVRLLAYDRHCLLHSKITSGQYSPISLCLC